MDFYGFMVFSISSLFAVIDPLGCIPFFSGQTQGMSRARKLGVLKKSLSVSLLVLLIFAYLGDYVLHLFGITIDAFRIAGGVIFFGIGLDMLQSKPRRWRTGLSAEDDELDNTPEPDHDPSITPLAIPMISGPGSITTVMVLKAQASDTLSVAFVSVAIILNLALAGLILYTADTVLRRLGHTGMKVVEKLMGLLVTVIAVQLIMSGLKPFILDILGR